MIWILPINFCLISVRFIDLTVLITISDELCGKTQQLPGIATTVINIELVDSCIKKLALKKACGPDDLSAEHLLYAHPCLVSVLRDLFYSVVAHGHVPCSFGERFIVPLVKDKSSNLNSIDNYRPITIIPIISKVFEHVLRSLCEDVL